MKKVKKFLEYAIDVREDKKSMKMQMECAFDNLKKIEYRAPFQERFAFHTVIHRMRFDRHVASCDVDRLSRYYLQLPTSKAHENHTPLPGQPVPQQQHVTTLASALNVADLEPATDSESSSCGRLHPCVRERLRQLVASGELRLYAIRKQLR